MVIGIVAHQTRLEQAKNLCHEVRAEHLSVDDGTLGCDRNHQQVLRVLATAHDKWCVVLEDDAVPVPNLRYHLTQPLALAPGPIVGLYLGRQRPPQHQAAIERAVTNADNVDASFIVSDRLYHAVGYAIRTTEVPNLLQWRSNWPIDQHITEWAQHHNHPVAYTWPSLVDHADQSTLFMHPDNQPRPPGRVAWKHGTRPHWTITTVRTAP